MELIIQLLISMVFSAYFSGMEIAFVSSNKLRFEMEKTNNVSSYILSVFYRHSNNFISTMLVGNNIALVIYGILMAQLIEHYILADVISNQALLVPIETVISTLIILVTGEFLPKTLFKINPNATLKFFSVPTFVCYIILYPISRFSSMLSSGILHLVGVKTNKEDREKAFTKVDLDYFIQSSIEEKEGEEIDNEIKIFRNALDFSNVKIRDCMIPRTEIIAVDFDTPLTELKKVFIENDANCAALGEAYAGCGNGAKDFVAVTLGTGVGSGVIIGGKIVNGVNYAGGECGHMVIVVDGEQCSCGRKGCWEAYASATALIRQTKKAMEEYPDSLMHKLAKEEGKVSGRTAFDAMRLGDIAGIKVVDDYIKYVACGLINIVNALQPEIICIGGGICNEGETLMKPLRRFVQSERYSIHSKIQTKIVKAELGNDAGVIGAALLGKVK